MDDQTQLPITPDFDHWPLTHTPTRVEAVDGALSVEWSDGLECRYHPLLLAENDTAADCLNPVTRETILSPLDFPQDLAVAGGRLLDNGVVEASWSDGRRPSRFHPGWLRAHGWFGTSERHQPVLWRAADLPEPPTFSGPDALADPAVFRDWLVALRDYGVARLEGLADEDGLLLRVVQMIGVVRETNFGRTYTLDIRPDPDSNAYTSLPLPQHIDLPTRECPPGLQFLFCRENTASGGAGTYTDAYRVAEDMRVEEPDHFEALTTLSWAYNNRAKTTSYRASGPVIALDETGSVAAVRYNSWLRSPFVGPLEHQDLAYRSYRAFAARAESSDYQLQVSYRAGDLFAFDNRRALHGRKAYDPGTGRRFIEGVYSDRDELHSAIRMLDRDRAASG